MNVALKRCDEALSVELQKRSSSIQNGDKLDLALLASSISARCSADFLLGANGGALDLTADVAEPFERLQRWVGSRLSLPLEGFSTLAWLFAMKLRADKRRLRDRISKLIAPSAVVDALGGLDQAKDEAISLLFAGYETTAVSAIWTLLLLAEHPAVAARVSEESQALPHDRSPTLMELSGLAFVRAVVKEALRLYPPVWAATRRCTTSTSIGGVSFTRSCHVLVDIYAIHRSASVWIDPGSFRPDRFLDTQVPAAYIPFGVGPRQCIGLHLGLLEVMLIVARLASKYRVISADGICNARAGMTLRPRKTPFVSFEAMS
jgi:cytochrome P450